jgi:hypothetical protein
VTAIECDPACTVEVSARLTVVLHDQLAQPLARLSEYMIRSSAASALPPEKGIAAVMAIKRRRKGTTLLIDLVNKASFW